MTNYEVKDERLESLLKRIATSFSKQLPEDIGFTLFLFTYGEDGNLFYISSAQREDMINVVKEWLDKQNDQK